MAWIRIDDQFADHPKVAMAGPLAAWMHVKALVYCGRYLTDGFVPRAIAHTLVNWSDAGVMVETGGNSFAGSCDTPSCIDLAVALVECGLWEDADGGYRIHDYLKHNPSRSDVEATRAETSAKRSEAGRRGAATRWNGKHGKPDGKAMANDMAKPMANASQTPWQTDGKAMAPSPSPSRVVGEKAARATATPLGAILSQAPELDGVDCEMLATELRKDTLGRGWTEDRIRKCMPRALEVMRQQDRPVTNRVRFMVQTIRQLAPPNALETHNAADDVKSKWRTEKAAETVEKYQASKGETAQGFAADAVADMERTEREARERSRAGTGTASAGDLFASVGKGAA